MIPIPKPPFSIRRTVGNHLPVYKLNEIGGTFAVTVVKKIKGQIEPLRRDLSILTRSQAQAFSDGSIKIQGDHKVMVRKYLEGLGF